MLVDRIYIPKIISEEQALIEYENEKKLKSIFKKVKKIKHYYVLYSYEDEEKDIDALEIRDIVKLFYKKTFFYFIEKNEENEYLIFAGNTYVLNEGTFKKTKMPAFKIKKLENLIKLDRSVLNIEESVFFFINLTEEEKEKILSLVPNAKEGNLKKILFFIFPGRNILKKYRVFFLAIFINFIIYLGISYYLKEKQHQIWQEQEQIVKNYQDKTENLRIRMRKIQKEIKYYYIPKNIQIYK